MASRERFDVNYMVLAEARRQVRNCWWHFKACLAALEGDESAKPMTLQMPSMASFDNDDLELFYKCKEIGDKLHGREKETDTVCEAGAGG